MCDNRLSGFHTAPTLQNLALLFPIVPQETVGTVPSRNAAPSVAKETMSALFVQAVELRLVAG